MPWSEFKDTLSHARLLVMQSLRIGNIVLSKLHFLLSHTVKLSFVWFSILYTHSDYILFDCLELVVLHLKVLVSTGKLLLLVFVFFTLTLVFFGQLYHICVSFSSLAFLTLNFLKHIVYASFGCQIFINLCLSRYSCLSPLSLQFSLFFDL